MHLNSVSTNIFLTFLWRSHRRQTMTCLSCPPQPHVPLNESGSILKGLGTKVWAQIPMCATVGGRFPKCIRTAYAQGELSEDMGGWLIERLHWLHNGHTGKCGVWCLCFRATNGGGLGPQTEVDCARGGVHVEAPVHGGGCSSSAPGRSARSVGPWHDAVHEGSGQ